MAENGQRGRRLGWGIAALLGVSSCGEAGTFACQDEADCSNGICQPTGYCSFPDTDCPTGQRYGDFAEAGLAGQCVSAEGGSSGDAPPSTSASTGADGGTTAGPTSSPPLPTLTSGGDPTTTASTATTDPGPSSDAGESAMCEDGIRSPGELCFELDWPDTYEAPYRVSDLAAGDFDNNGTADLVLLADVSAVDDEVHDSLCLFRADGIGGFVPEDDCEDLGEDGERVRMLDGNADGRFEAIVLTSAELQTWRWLGGAIVRRSVSLPPTGGNGVHDFALGDFDGDAHTDVLYAWAYGYGTFMGHTTNLAWALDAGTEMEVGGIPGEGAAGVGLLPGDALGESTSYVAFFPNQYTPALATAQWSGTAFGATPESPSWEACEGAANGALHLTAGDFDGDGADDLVASCTNGAIAIMLWDGVTFSSTTTTLAGAHHPVVGDATGDGVDEILVPSSLDVAVLFEVVDGVATILAEFDAGGPDPAATLADLNEDGALDVATAATLGAAGQLRVWLQAP